MRSKRSRTGPIQSLPRALEENEEEAVYLQGCVPPGPPGRGPVLLTTSRVPPAAQDPALCPPREVATWPVSTASATSQKVPFHGPQGFTNLLMAQEQ